MPRRTSLDASKFNEIISVDNVPTLFEYCVDALVNSNHQNLLESIQVGDQKALARKIIDKQRITRESLLLFSTHASLSCCINLDLSSSAIMDHGLYIISGITSLLKLNLYNCKNITNKGLSYLKSLVYLEQLDISKCKQINDEGLPNLSYMRSLQKLDVNDIQGGLGKGLIVATKRMNVLSHLSMERSRFAAAFISELQSLPVLSFLSLKDTKTISDEQIVQLSSFPSLTDINLSGTMVSSKGLHILQGMLMGRNDIQKVSISNPAIVKILKRNMDDISKIKSDKELNRIPSLFPSRDIVNYVTSLVSSKPSLSLQRSFEKLAVRDKENSSFKESSPLTKMMHHIKGNMQPLPHGSLDIKKLSTPSFDSDTETESEEDSDSEIIILSSDEEDTAKLFAFNEQDEDDICDEFQISIGSIPGLPINHHDREDRTNISEECYITETKTSKKQGRGRPKKSLVPNRGRGRPRKSIESISPKDTSLRKPSIHNSDENISQEKSQSKQRGRPRKSFICNSTDKESNETSPKRGRGRPRKSSICNSNDKQVIETSPKRGRGRPRKSSICENSSKNVKETNKENQYVSSKPRRLSLSRQFKLLSTNDKPTKRRARSKSLTTKTSEDDYLMEDDSYEEDSIIDNSPETKRVNRKTRRNSNIFSNDSTKSLTRQFREIGV